MSKIKSFKEPISFLILFCHLHNSYELDFIILHLSDEETKAHNIIKVTFPNITNLIKRQSMPTSSFQSSSLANKLSCVSNSFQRKENTLVNKESISEIGSLIKPSFYSGSLLKFMGDI